MNSATQRSRIEGPAGAIECAINRPADREPVGVAVLCHPHPLFGGTMDNKVVHTLARTFVQMGYVSVRFNFRGIGGSGGAWGEGIGEVDDALAVIAAHRAAGRPLALGGFSFGGYVAAAAAARLHPAAQGLVLIAPAVVNFPAPPVPAGTVLVHGELDDVVPLQAVLEWAQPQNLHVNVIPGSGHFFHGQLPLLKQTVIDAWSSARA